MKLRLNYHPTQEVLDSFLPILKQEYEEEGKGMYCNWDVVLKRHKEDHLFAFLLDEKPVGFLTWCREEKIVFLEIIWLSPICRGKGIGKAFQELITKEFKKRGDVAVWLYCSSEQGVGLALSANFQPMSSLARMEHPQFCLGRDASYIKILKNQEFYKPQGALICTVFESYGDKVPLFEFPLDCNFSAIPTYIHAKFSWYGKVFLNGMEIRQSKMEHLLKELKVRYFNYQVACFDTDIVIPSNWQPK